MKDYLGFLLLSVLVVLDVMPAAITLILSRDRTYIPKKSTARKWIDLFVLGSCAAVHMGAYMLVHKILRGRWNFLYTAKRIVAFDFTYQQIDYWPVSLAIRLVVAFVLGWLIRLILSKAKKGHYKCAPLSKRRIATLFFLLSMVGVAVIGTVYYGLTGTRAIVINEVGGYNDSTALDADGTVCDYIELYNNGALDCTVSRLYLTDDIDHLKKKEIPAVTIPAKGYLLITLKDTTFHINKDGLETVILSDDWGNILDQVTTVAVEPDYSYSRAQDGFGAWAICSGTPGRSNTEGTRRLEKFPVLSHESGFYDAEFNLQISTEDGATIYYTLDGSVPTTQSLVYTQPIRVYDRSHEPNIWRSQQRVQSDWENYSPDLTPVDKAFIVRAMAVSRDGAVSKPVTATYFVGLDQYADGAVVSLVAEPEDIWGEDGIYVTGKAYDDWYLGGKVGTSPGINYSQRGREWERTAHLFYLSEDLSFSQEVGLRVAGGSSRARALKAFSLYAREEYSGKGLFNETIFPDIQSKRISIRGGYANAICQMLVPDRSFGVQNNQRVAVFLNGEFWYHANILEKYDEQYFYAHYGVDPSNVVIVEKGLLGEGQEGDEKLLSEIYTYLKANDISDSEAYAGFGEIVDLQSYIDYMCFNIYIDNMDFTESKNSVWWRSREKTFNPYEDGKWRFLLYDLDAMEWGDASMWGLERQAQKNSFSLMPRYTNGVPINQQTIYAALIKNPEFKKQFVLTFMDMVNTNFQYEKVLAVLDAYGRNTEGYLSGNGGTRKSSYYEEFFKERASYIVPFMAEEFGLSGTLETLTLQQNDLAGGTLLLNTVQPDMTDGQWSGQYYTDHPVTVTAVPAAGYRFVGWEGAVHSDDQQVQVKLTKGGTQLNAVFEKIPTP